MENIYKNNDQIKVLDEIIKSNPLKTLSNIKQELSEKNIYLNDKNYKKSFIKNKKRKLYKR